MKRAEKNLIKKIKHNEYFWESYSQNHIQDIASLQSKLCNIIKKYGFTKEAKNILKIQNSIRKKGGDLCDKWVDLNHQLRASWYLE